MVNVYECEVPLYRIKSYDNFLFRVTKRLFDYNPNKVSLKKEQQSDDRPVAKFDSALSRAKNTVRELALCNKWDYFVTLTFDSRWDRYSLSNRAKELMQWIQNENKKGAHIRYLLVPEFHDDGAVHFHGLMSGIDVTSRPLFWPKGVNLKDDGSYYDVWGAYSSRYGYSSVEPVNNPLAVGFYVSKYITKSLADSAQYVGLHTYFRSRGLSRALEVGCCYSSSPALDKCCKFENPFYKFGFCKFDDVGNAVDLCDEVSFMFQNYLVEDPVTGDVVALFGANDDDPYVQEMIVGFNDLGLVCRLYDEEDVD